MTEAHKILYIKLHGEMIKHFQDTRNSGRFTDGGFPKELAEQCAEHQLKCDLKFGEFRVTIEELLLHSLEECIVIERNRMQKRFSKLISELNKWENSQKKNL